MIYVIVYPVCCVFDVYVHARHVVRAVLHCVPPTTGCWPPHTATVLQPHSSHSSHCVASLGPATHIDKYFPLQCCLLHSMQVCRFYSGLHKLRFCGVHVQPTHAAQSHWLSVTLESGAEHG